MSEKPTQEEDNDGKDGRSLLSRRGTLGMLGVAGLGSMVGSASANDRAELQDGFAPWRHWPGDVNANGSELYNLAALELAESDAITDLAGEGLSIDDGVLNAEGGSGEESPVMILHDEMAEADVRETISNASTPAAFVVEPGASWTLTETLEIPDHTTIRAWSSRYYEEGPDTFKKGFDGTLAEVGRHVTLSGVSFHGNTDEGYDGDGVRVINQRENRFIRVTIRQNTGDGLVLDNVYMSYFNRCWSIRNNGWGVIFRDDLAEPSGAHHISQNTFQRCEIAENGEGGVKYDLRDEVSVFDNVSVYGNEGPAYEFSENRPRGDSLGNSIRAGYITLNEGPPVLVSGGDWSISVEDTILNGNNSNPSEELTTPVGMFHTEDGRADFDVRNTINGDGDTLYAAHNDEAQNLNVSGAATGANPGGLAGDIVGPNTRLTCQNLSVLQGDDDIDVDTGIALNPLNGGSVEHFGE